jgi:hypothetical protein
MSRAIWDWGFTRFWIFDFGLGNGEGGMRNAECGMRNLKKCNYIDV